VDKSNETQDPAGENNGFITDATDFSAILPQLNPPLSQDDVVRLYAVEHNPFAYFRSVQEGSEPRNSPRNVVGFEGRRGLTSRCSSRWRPASGCRVSTTPVTRT
jgi:hypothetical protein